MKPSLMKHLTKRLKCQQRSNNNGYIYLRNNGYYKTETDSVKPSSRFHKCFKRKHFWEFQFSTFCDIDWKAQDWHSTYLLCSCLFDLVLTCLSIEIKPGKVEEKNQDVCCSSFKHLYNILYTWKFTVYVQKLENNRSSILYRTAISNQQYSTS